jgi:uncharacterized protein YkwD
MTRSAFAALLLGWLVCGPAHAQHAEEENGEKIEAPATPDDSGKRPDLAKVIQLITEHTNAFREQEKRGPVAVNKELAAAAQYFADYMAKNDEYGHTADGKRPTERANQHGYDHCIVLENIAYAFDSRGFDAGPLGERFFTGWRESSGHRKNMLDPDVTETGVAVARSEKTGHYYAVQMFGRPKSAALEFKIHNRSDEAIRYVIEEETFNLPPRATRTHRRCRPAEASFIWPGEEKPDASVKPASGETFVVTKDGNEFAVKKQ